MNIKFTFSTPGKMHRHLRLVVLLMFCASPVFSRGAGPELPIGVAHPSALTEATTAPGPYYWFSLFGTGPGNVTADLSLWLRADAGVTTAGTQVASWADQSGNSNDATASPDGGGVYNAGDEFNFNPGITFDPAVAARARLVGANPLAAFVDGAGGEVGDFTYFSVLRTNNPNGDKCGAQIFNFFDSEDLLEIEAFSSNGCGEFSNQNSYGIFNGPSFYLTGEIDSRNESLLTYDYDGPGAGNIDAFVNGRLATENDFRTFENPIFDATRPYSIGAATDTGDPTVNLDVNVAAMSIAEIVVLGSTVSAADKLRIESYLAIKYGLTLGTNYVNSAGQVVYGTTTTEAGFANGIIGIGLDTDACLDQRQSRPSTSPDLIIGDTEIATTNLGNVNGQIGTDNSYLIVGSNGLLPNFATTGGPTDWTHLNDRIWKVRETSAGAAADIVTDMDLSFSLAELLLDGPLETYALAVDTDGDQDFTNATIFENGTISNGRLVFEGINLNDNDYFTLVNPSCAISITIGNVDCNDNVFTITGTIDYDYALLDDLPDEITLRLGTIEQTFGPFNAAVGSQAFSIVRNGTGVNIPLSAAFNIDENCRDVLSLDLSSCAGACVADPQEISGTIFVDLNVNGMRDDGEAGQAGVSVELYTDNSGTPVSTIVTGPSGDYSFMGLDPAVTYRVQYAAPPIFAAGSPNLFNGNNLSDVFFTKPGVCGRDGGAISIALCEGDFQYVTACYSRADPADPAGANETALVSILQDAGGSGTEVIDYISPPIMPIDIGIGEVGAIYGVAFDKYNQRLFSAPTVKSKAALRPGGDIGDIYVSDNTPNTGSGQQVTTATTFMNIPNLGTVIMDTPAEFEDGLDDKLFSIIAKRGMGDIEVSLDGSRLYATDLFNRQLMIIPLPEDGSSPAVADIVRVPLPQPASCPIIDTLRPFGIGQDPVSGRVVVGAVCDASVSEDVTNLNAYVYQLDASNALSPVFEMDMDYPRQQLWWGTPGAWNPWIDTFDVNRINFITNSGNTFGAASYPQPMLVDIEFEAGDLLLGFGDRFPNQFADLPQGALKNPTAAPLSVFSGGDVLRAGWQGGNNWVLESNGMTNGILTGPLSSVSTSPNSGPGGGEFFGEENYSRIGHFETAEGAMAIVPGQPLVITGYDVGKAADEKQNDTGGLLFFNVEDGSWNRSFRLYQRDNELFFAKGNGFGDVEAVCLAEPTYQVGNRAWVDTDMDGIQDPSEPVLAGLPIALYDADGNLLATTVTDANGQYLFSGPETQMGAEMWQPNTDRLKPGDEIFIVFGTDGLGNDVFDTNTNELTVDGATFTVTDPNEGEGGNPDANDSDASLTVPGTPRAGFPTIPFTVPVTQGNFSLDFGAQTVDFDLALNKVVAASTPGPYFQGDLVDYTITVFNQGGVDATRIFVQDYIPERMSFNSATTGAVTTTMGATVNVTSAPSGVFTIDALAAGDAVELTISLRIRNTTALILGGNIDNWAEIRSADNDDDPTNSPPVDVDSTPDATNFNQTGETDDLTDDNVVNENGKDGGDEDDHDPARITVENCNIPNCGDEPTSRVIENE